MHMWLSGREIKKNNPQAVVVVTKALYNISSLVIITAEMWQADRASMHARQALISRSWGRDSKRSPSCPFTSIPVTLSGLCCCQVSHELSTGVTQFIRQPICVISIQCTSVSVASLVRHETTVSSYRLPSSSEVAEAIEHDIQQNVDVIFNVSKLPRIGIWIGRLKEASTPDQFSSFGRYQFTE